MAKLLRFPQCVCKRGSPLGGDVKEADMNRIDARIVALGLLVAGVLLGTLALVSSYQDLNGGTSTMSTTPPKVHGSAAEPRRV
jgi:hypothetical protein